MPRHAALIYAGIASLILIADQLSKWAIMEHLLRVDSPAIGLIDWLFNAPDPLGYAYVYVAPFFNLVMVWNQGISFGLFAAESSYQPYLLSGLSILICIALTIWYVKLDEIKLRIAIAIVIGGAVGNVLDRIRFGAVADFFDFHVFGWHYPAFNIADSAIVLGVAYLAIDALFFEISREKQRNDS